MTSPPQQPPPRRSRRNAYKSLAELQRRAQAATPADEAEAWGDAGLLDDADDDSFDEAAMSDTGSDQVDSDFDAPEDGVEAEQEAAAVAAESHARSAERRSRRKSSTYVDPARKRSTAQHPRRVGVNGSGVKPIISGSSEDKSRQPSTTTATTSLTTVQGARLSLRKSTKVASARAAESRRSALVESELRRKARAAREAQRKPVVPLTQEQRLSNARVTEKDNATSLDKLLRVEEEKKRAAAPTRKAETRGPVVSVRSREGVTTVSVSEGVDVQETLLGIVSNGGGGDGGKGELKDDVDGGGGGEIMTSVK